MNIGMLAINTKEEVMDLDNQIPHKEQSKNDQNQVEV
jgi:hypothetical protein